MQQQTATPPRLSYNRIEAAAALDISVGKLDQLVASGQLAVVRIGRRVTVPRTALERFLDESLRAA